MIVKTSELTGAALDWAVAKVISRAAEWDSSSGLLWFESSGHEWLVWSPSSDWEQGGPLLDKYNVWLSDDEGEAVASCHPHVNEFIHGASTRLIAACRAIVQSQLGNTVDVPEGLL